MLKFIKHLWSRDLSDNIPAVVLRSLYDHACHSLEDAKTQYQNPEQFTFRQRIKIRRS